MSLVTLNKFLNARTRGDVGASGAAVNENLAEGSAAGYSDLADRILAAIRHSVVCGEHYTDLFEEIGAVRNEMYLEPDQQSLDTSAQRVEEALEKYQSRLRQTDSERASDLRNVLDMLNESLSYLTADIQKTETRRRQLESNLTAAARVDDIAVLRKQLSKMLQTVREEARADKGLAEQVINNMGRQIQQVHKAQARFQSQLPGRADAIEFIRQVLESGGRTGGFHAALFVADSLGAIRERHGEEVGNLLLQDLGRKRVQALVADGSVFSWAPNALLLAWNHTDSAKSGNELVAQLRSPCEQRAFVGSRVAIFNLTIRSLVIQAHGDMDQLVTSLDRFHKRG